MKIFKKSIESIAILLSLLITFTFTTYASPQFNTVSSSEAVNLALFYFCSRSLDKEIVSFDKYVVTPLYDNKGNITYYCVDFFENDGGCGYVVVGGNLTYIQCPEFSLEGTSLYYKNQVNGSQNIYFSPFETYKTDGKAYYNQAGKELSNKQVAGTIFKGDRNKNKELLLSSQSTIYPEDNPDHFSTDPAVYLENIGFTGVFCSTYGTLESSMTNSKNNMYTSLPRTLTDGSTLYNPNHCVITAIANIFLYWRSVCCPSYPSNYDQMFTSICNTACNLKNTDGTSYFSKTGSKNFFGSTANTMLSANSTYNYSGRTFYSDWASWNFLTTYINNNWPILLGFESAPSNFDYAYHATVAFGYTVMNGWRNGDFYSYYFVKLYDGWASGNGAQYICWDMLNTLDVSTYMVAFCPYQA